jgi:hypothetical protein
MINVCVRTHAIARQLHSGSHEHDVIAMRPKLQSRFVIMSQKTVQLTIGRLLTDDEYRRCFLRDPRATLLALRDQGFDLTTAEIGALIRTDAKIWTDAAARIDASLQRCSLHDE